MPKLLEYTELTSSQGCNPVFIGDKAVSLTNPEIKYITIDNLFKRQSLYALNASGLTIYDDGGSIGIFVKDGGNVGIGAATANYSLQVNGDFYVTGGIYDCNGSAGTADQYLKSVGSSNYVWTDTSTLGGGSVTGSGTANYIPKWSSSSALANSIIYELSSKIGIGETSPGATVHITGAAAGSDTIIQNSTNGAALELRRDATTTTTNSLYLSNTTSGFSLGNYSSWNVCNLNMNKTGSIGVKTTTLAASLSVFEESSGLIADFCSNNTSGSHIFFKNSSATPYSNVISYSNYESSIQKVNWITGTFKDGSVKSFGIHFKDTAISASCSKFDTSCVANNLFYINTLGNQYLAKSINTHNCTNTGHNTGRFICVHSVPFYIVSPGFSDLISDFTYIPAIGAHTESGFYGVGSPSGYTNCINWNCTNNADIDGLQSWGRIFYTASLIKITSYLTSHVFGAGERDFCVRFYCADAAATSFTWGTSNHCKSQTVAAASYNPNNSGHFCNSVNVTDLSGSPLDIDVNSYLAAGIIGSSGAVYGTINFTYEMKIT